MADQTFTNSSEMGNGTAGNAAKGKGKAKVEDGKRLSHLTFRVPPIKEEGEADEGEEEADSVASSELWQDIAQEAAEQTGGSHQYANQEPALPLVMQSTKPPPILIMHQPMEWDEDFFKRDKDELNNQIARSGRFGGLFDEDNSPNGVPLNPGNALWGRPTPPDSPIPSPAQSPRQTPTPEALPNPVQKEAPPASTTTKGKGAVISSSPLGSSPRSVQRRRTFSPQSLEREKDTSPNSSTGSPQKPSLVRRRTTLQPNTNAKVAFFENLGK